jgi:GT2 family glycosyltransferase
MNTTHLLDIIVLSYQKFEATTQQCLVSLQSDLCPQWHRVVIVDNGSSDGSAVKLRSFSKHFSSTQTLYLEENLGFSAGMNWGASQSNGKWILLVNSDTIFLKNSLSILTEKIKRLADDIGMIGPITNSAGTAQNYSLNGGIDDILSAGADLQRRVTDLLIPAYRLDFFCVAIRRDLWTRLGGLDTSFGLGYYEDVDFSLKARALGFRLMICEDVFVYHKGSATFSEYSHRGALIKRNKKILRKRHPSSALPHQREDNLRVIEYCLGLCEEGFGRDGLLFRLRLRTQDLIINTPRSFFKRLRWKLRIKNTVDRAQVIYEMK